jgi:uncharacterized protein (DUF305 family)
MRGRPVRAAALTLVTAVALVALGPPAGGERAVHVRPGAPGEPTREISPDAPVPAPSGDTRAEVAFVQHMLVHHAQAVTMSALAPERAASERVLTLAERIALAQQGEIAQLRRWLRARGEEVPPQPADGHDEPDPADHGHLHDADMPGLLSGAQLAELEAADGHAFDVRFLELMIEHHRGALAMVATLEEATGGHPEPTVSVMAREIRDVQRTEINRMVALLVDLGA